MRPLPAVYAAPPPPNCAQATPAIVIAAPAILSAENDSPSVSQATMDSTLKAHYDALKAASIVDVPGISGGKAVKFNNPNKVAISTSMKVFTGAF